jgi:membrane protein DedA with SNARE-associated domain
MEHLITDYILQYGYLAVFVLMVLESACIPVPSEVTMLFGGALANSAFVASLGSKGEQLNFVLVALLGTLGNLVGSWIAWAVGYAGGRPLIERWGRFVFLRKHELDRAEAWFGRHGQTAVLVSRVLPVVRTFISLPAGVAEMPFARFSLYTFVGCLPWTFALTAVGYALGSQCRALPAAAELRGRGADRAGGRLVARQALVGAARAAAGQARALPEGHGRSRRRRGGRRGDCGQTLAQTSLHAVASLSRVAGSDRAATCEVDRRSAGIGRQPRLKSVGPARA